MTIHPDTLTRVMLTILAIKAEWAVPADEIADRYIEDEGLVAPDPDTLMPSLTERGLAYWAMLVKTPLPVQLAKWGDPRILADPEGAAKPPVEYKWSKVDLGAETRSAPLAKPEGTQPIISHEMLPPGFSQNLWTNGLPNVDTGDGAQRQQLPPGLDRDTPLIVIGRNGVQRPARGELLAGQVNWKHNGKPDDVIGWRRAE